MSIKMTDFEVRPIGLKVHILFRGSVMVSLSCPVSYQDFLLGFDLAYDRAVASLTPIERPKLIEEVDNDGD